MKGRGRGWVTAEYGMLPRSTGQRSPREAARGRQGGRTLEIQRLIGRSLRAVVDMGALGERTIIVDCDVIQADGGTRTAAITGGYVALVDAVSRLRARARPRRDPIHGAVAAVSVGIWRGEPVLDLDYAEDSEAETDMNVAMNDAGGFIEIQGTAEGHAFRRAELDAMLELARRGAARSYRSSRCSARRPGPDREPWARRRSGGPVREPGWQGREGSCSQARTPASSPSCVRCWNRRGLHVVSQDAYGVEQPEETGLTFVENALIKARAACAATGLPALADDSGVVVDALGGAPGVRSARYAGDGASDADNLARLLEALAGVEPPDRGAAFVCALVYLRHAHDPSPIVCEGVWRGRILDAPRGGGGFGYDPVFFVEALGRTAAELSRVEKNAVSHRGRALAQLLGRLAG